MGVGNIAFTFVAAFVGYILQPIFFPGEVSKDFEIITEAPVLTECLNKYKSDIGDSFNAYRNHGLRTLSFTLYFLKHQGEGKEAISVDQAKRALLESALCYHDLALWTDKALDYLDPSADRARADLTAANMSASDLNLVEAIIQEHHKVTPWHGDGEEYVNAVRLADWLDFTQNAGIALRSGMPSGNVYAANLALPKLGFIKILMRRPFEIMPENPLAGNLLVARIFKW